MKHSLSNEERIGYDFYADIAERVVEGRKMKGWTQKQLADAVKWSESKVARIELVQIRSKLDDVQNLAKSLDVEVNWLIQAERDSQAGDCRYLVWHERWDDFKLYMDASSGRLAFLKVDDIVSKMHCRFLEPRDRARVKLVGIPICDNEIKDRFPKKTAEEETVEPDE